MTHPTHKTARRRALEAPHQQDHDASIQSRMGKGIMPTTLNGLLRWYSEGWDAEVPTAIHKSEVWRDHGTQAEGGSRLGTPAHTDPFRRYMEGTPSQIDQDGWYLLPMHAALARLGRRWPLTARALFAVAQSGWDWRGVADRLGYAEEMFVLFLEMALIRIWHEYREEVVRLT